MLPLTLRRVKGSFRVGVAPLHVVLEVQVNRKECSWKFVNSSNLLFFWM
jgi:hypothetical protein